MDTVVVDRVTISQSTTIVNAAVARIRQPTEPNQINQSGVTANRDVESSAGINRVRTF
jgi:hypothetical protein